MNKSADSLSRAKKSAVNMLSYADNTEKQLREKLSRKGFSKEDIDGAIAYLHEYRYINETAHAKRLCDSLVRVKLWGRRRIVREMKLRGFSESDIEAAGIDDIDFSEYCSLALEKYGKEDKDGTIAALLRRGYSLDEIKRAMKNS